MDENTREKKMKKKVNVQIVLIDDIVKIKIIDYRIYCERMKTFVKDKWILDKNDCIVKGLFKIYDLKKGINYLENVDISSLGYDQCDKAVAI